MTDAGLHLGQPLDAAILDSLADFICGDDTERFPKYRTSTGLTQFMDDVGIRARHDGSTRKWWVLDVLRELQPDRLERVILRLVDLREYRGNKQQLGLAVRSMNDILAMDALSVTFRGTVPILARASPISLDLQDLADPAATEPEAEQFLRKQFSDDIKIDDLGLDSVVTSFLQSRVDEVQACPRDKVPLGTIFLLGSTLEGILIAVASKDSVTFMSASTAPKNKAGTVLKVHDWKLNDLITVANELGRLNHDVSRFSHVLRDFRNYIHPYHQMAKGFMPDQHTVDICWQVFKAAFAQLKSSSA